MGPFWLIAFAIMFSSFSVDTGRAEPQPVSIAPNIISVPAQTSISYGDVYGAVRFEIEKFSVPNQKMWLKSLIEKVFGVATSGEYVVALELIDPSQTGDDKLIARRIIAHFVKDPEGNVVTDLLKFISNDQSGRKVQNSSIVVFSGDLVPRVPVNQRTNGYSVVLQVYKTNAAQLTSGDLVIAVNDLINTSAGALNFAPLDTSIKAAYSQMRSFGFQMYKVFADTPTSVASVAKMSFIKRTDDENLAPNAVRFTFPYNFAYPAEKSLQIDGKTYDNTISVVVRFVTYSSEIGNFSNNKFSTPRNWSQWLVQANVAGKGLIPVLLEATETKTFVAALEGGPSSTKDFLSSKGTGDDQVKAAAIQGCDAVVRKLAGYYSSPDVGALYWAFLHQYWSSLGDKAGRACQEKYAEIYFDLYDLPKIATTPVAPRLSSLTVDKRFKSERIFTTLNDAMARVQTGESPATILRDFQGISRSERSQ